MLEERGGGETYRFEKKDDTWYDAEDETLNIYQARITAMLVKVANLSAEQTISDVIDLSQYGLETPERYVEFSTADATYRLNFGNLNSMTSQYYVAFDGETSVYAVTTNVVTGFNYTLEDLIEEDEETQAETEDTEEDETETNESETIESEAAEDVEAPESTEVAESTDAIES